VDFEHVNVKKDREKLTWLLHLLQAVGQMWWCYAHSIVDKRSPSNRCRSFCICFQVDMVWALGNGCFTDFICGGTIYMYNNWVTRIHTHIHTLIHTHIHMDTHIHTHTRTYTRIHMYTRMNTHIHTVTLHLT
jgi:hypothetical protein